MLRKSVLIKQFGFLAIFRGSAETWVTGSPISPQKTRPGTSAVIDRPLEFKNPNFHGNNSKKQPK